MFLKVIITCLILCLDNLVFVSLEDTAFKPGHETSSETQTHPQARINKEQIASVHIHAGNLSSSENATKRGFLANLATLLNDAEEMSRKDPDLSPDGRSGSAMSSISHKDSHNISNKTAAFINSTSETAPSVGEVEQSLITEGKRFAPIFAYFHGKIVPLGRLPATSFHKSHEDDVPDSEAITPIPDAKITSNFPPQETPSKAVASSSAKSEVEKAPVIQDSTNKKITTENPPATKSQNSIIKKEKTSDTEAVAKSLRVLSPMKYEKLSKFFKTLEGQSKPAKQTRTLRTKNVAGVQKDEVTFPEDTATARTNDVMTHVKALLLDNGKVLHIPEKAPAVPQPAIQENPKVKSADTEGVQEDSGERYFVAEDGSLTPMFKAKETETEQATARDMNENDKVPEKVNSDKTVTLSIDMLKDLLKKSDSKVSLAQLLNEKSKAETKPENQEEDPGTIEDFAAGGLKKHNEFRGQHHSPALVWSDDLANEAQKLAEELADKKALEISKDLEKKGYGENVAKVWANFKCAGEAATKMWYTQSANYKYYDPQLDENTGQFAQVVWKDTKELGMGVAKSIDDVNNKYVYVVALYRPPGNIEATLRDNVIPKGNNTVDVYSTFFKRSGKIHKKRSFVTSLELT